MARKIVIVICGLVVGIFVSYLIVLYSPYFHRMDSKEISLPYLDLTEKNIIGFLPYWLIAKAQNDYSSAITTLTYFGLTIGPDGKIVKKTNLQESDPGWYALSSGKVQPFLVNARKHGQNLSLLVFQANDEVINELLSDPIVHARNMIEDIKPIMQEKKFKDLNVDIESVSIASDESRLAFTQFVQEVKKGMDENHLGTLTLDIAPDALIKKYMINLTDIAPLADHIVLMAYDYHYIGSLVSGPVAPLAGAGTISEFDTRVAVSEMLKVVPQKKIILGVPLYGYEWETINESTRSATLPSSGLTATTARVEKLLASCASCSAQFDQVALENYLVYKDQDTGTFHQIFYPSVRSMSAKIEYVKNEKLGGVALWALGYEAADLLIPLKEYKSIIK